MKIVQFIRDEKYEAYLTDEGKLFERKMQIKAPKGEGLLAFFDNATPSFQWGEWKEREIML